MQGTEKVLLEELGITAQGVSSDFADDPDKAAGRWKHRVIPGVQGPSVGQGGFQGMARGSSGARAAFGIQAVDGPPVQAISQFMRSMVVPREAIGHVGIVAGMAVLGPSRVGR